jgi:hypothetical protein
VLSIGLLADSVIRRARSRPAADLGPRPARDARRAAHAHLQRRDLARLHAPAEREQPTLALTPIAVGETMLLGGKKIEVLPAAHTVPAVGFGVDGGSRRLVGLHRRHRARTRRSGSGCDDERSPTS